MQTKTTLSATERKQIADRIAKLEATPREMVGTDEGTHGKPAKHYVWEEITGERYGTRSFGGANATRYTEEECAALAFARLPEPRRAELLAVACV